MIVGFCGMFVACRRQVQRAVDSLTSVSRTQIGACGGPHTGGGNGGGAIRATMVRAVAVRPTIVRAAMVRVIALRATAVGTSTSEVDGGGGDDGE